MTRTPISSHAWRLPAAFFAAAILASTLAGSNPQTASAEDLAPDAGKIHNHVTYLSSDELGGRDSGEPGLEIAAEYIARFYAEYGSSRLETTAPTFNISPFPRAPASFRTPGRSSNSKMERRSP